MPSRRDVAAMASRSSSIFAPNRTGRDVPDEDPAAHARAHEGAGPQVLAPLEPAGFDLGRVPDVAAGFDTAGMRQEEIVNLGFKGLVLDAFAEAPGFELGK